MPRYPLAGLLLFTACQTTVIESYDDCVLELDVPEEVVTAGQSLTIGAKPATTTWDTVVRVGGENAVVTAVTRDDEAACLACDACREEAGCLSCGTCEACDESATCKACDETVTFDVPNLGAGDWPIVVFNFHGGSASAPVVTILPDTAIPHTDGTDSDSDAPDTDTDTDPTASTDSDVDTDGTDGDTDPTDSDSDATDTDTDGIDTDSTVP